MKPTSFLNAYKSFSQYFVCLKGASERREGNPAPFLLLYCMVYQHWALLPVFSSETVMCCAAFGYQNTAPSVDQC